MLEIIVKECMFLPFFSSLVFCCITVHLIYGNLSFFEISFFKSSLTQKKKVKLIKKIDLTLPLLIAMTVVLWNLSRVCLS